MSGFLKDCRKVKLSIEPDGPADVCPNCGGGFTQVFGDLQAY